MSCLYSAGAPLFEGGEDEEKGGKYEQEKR